MTIGPLPIYATLVVFQWSQSEILLAADSLSAKVRVERTDGVIACKIHQSGDIFFTVIGVNDDPTIKVDLVAVAEQAIHATTGGIVEKFARFETFAKPQIERIMSKGLPAWVSQEPQRINVVFADRKSHIVINKEYIRAENGSTSSAPRTVYAVPAKATGPTAIGVYAEADAELQKNPALQRLDGVPFIVGFIQSQIDYEKHRLRDLHMIPRVGGEICILRISNGVAAWVSGHQGTCPDIKSAGRAQRETQK